MAAIKEQTKRKANLELLRIVSMLGITMLHYLYGNNAFLMADDAITPLRIVGSVLESFCIPSVACYVLISGYCDDHTEFRLGRLFKVWAEVFVYSVFLHWILAGVGIAHAASSIWKAATYYLPILSGHYWFASAFIVMEIFAPILNAGAKKVSQKTLKSVIIALLVYESIIKTILPFELSQDGKGYDFGFFLLLFLMGAYLRLYGIPHFLSSKGKAFAGYVISCLIIGAVQIGASFLHEKTGSFSYLMSSPFHYNYFWAIAASICLFLLFLQIRIPEGNAADRIRILSSYTFGIYLIQCHTDLFSLWPTWSAELAGISADGSTILLFFLWAIVTVLLVYATGSLVDAVRKAVFDGVQQVWRRRKK